MAKQRVLIIQHHNRLNIKSNSMFCRCSTRYALLVAVGVILTAAFLLNYHVGQSDDQNLFNVTVVSDVLNSLVKILFKIKFY